MLLLIDSDQIGYITSQTSIDEDLSDQCTEPRLYGARWNKFVGAPMKALVTGGGGFLGKRIVELLRQRGDAVACLARRRYPSMDALGVQTIQADLRDMSSISNCMQRFDVVFHVASKVGYWGHDDEYWSINVRGTANLIEAMRRSGVSKLVYTSTPSVVGYARDVENGGSDIPYAEYFESTYQRTKAEAEKLVLAANGPGFCTVSLRPHAVIGPGDNHLLPRLIARAVSGWLPCVGNGRNQVDMTFVDNAAWAHIDAADALHDHASPHAGRAYFVSNDAPVIFWKWVNELLSELGYSQVRKKIPFGLAHFLGRVSEWAWSLLPLSGEPPLTRYLASALARSHYYDMSPAKRDFGYRIRVSMEEATTRTLQWLRTQA